MQRKPVFVEVGPHIINLSQITHVLKDHGHPRAINSTLIYFAGRDAPLSLDGEHEIQFHAAIAKAIAIVSSEEPVES
jgi:hypothetical protein